MAASYSKVAFSRRISNDIAGSSEAETSASGKAKYSISIK